MESMTNALTFSLLGMAIVFTVLAALAVFIGLLRRLDDRWLAAEAHAAAGDAPARDAQTIDDTTLVLIAAAVATVVGGRGRIRSIRRVLPSEGPASVWSMQGRSSLQGSHVITRGGRR